MNRIIQLGADVMKILNIQVVEATKNLPFIKAFTASSRSTIEVKEVTKQICGKRKIRLYYILWIHWPGKH